MNDTDAIVRAAQWQQAEINGLLALSEDYKDIARCRSWLELVAPMWEALCIGYKIAQVFDRIIARAEQIIIYDRDMLENARANWRGRASCEGDIEKLRGLISEMKFDKRGR